MKIVTKESVKFAKYPKIEIIAEQDGDCLRNNAIGIMENYLDMFPPGKIDAVLCENDEMGLGALQVIKVAGRDDLEGWVVLIDGQKDALEAIIAGDLIATLGVPSLLRGYSNNDNSEIPGRQGNPPNNKYTL